MDTNSEVQDYPSVNFTGNCGEASGNTPNSATCSGSGMQPWQTATVNGAPPSNCIVGNDNAKVFSITLLKIAGPYDYQISVVGQGPDSWDGGSFYLAFTDESNDTYYLSIFSSNQETHTVDYNSSAPNIKTIWWCDNSFTVPSDAANAKTTKPDFRVTSPAGKPVSTPVTK